MSFSILLVTATQMEADTFRKITALNASVSGLCESNGNFKLLVTGVGSIATAWTMTRWFSSNPQPDLAINAGIAGSYREEIEIGRVVVPVSDCFADAGVETEFGFETLAEAGLEKPDGFPFSGGRLFSDNRFVGLASERLRTVNAISVNTSTGTLATRRRLVNKFDPDIETMEGATFFYICSREKVPFLAIRSISNIVEARDRSRWNIPLALDNLALELQKFILNIN